MLSQSTTLRKTRLKRYVAQLNSPGPILPFVLLKLTNLFLVRAMDPEEQVEDDSRISWSFGATTERTRK